MNINTTQSPLSEWNMLKLIQIIRKKNLQIDVTRIWFVTIKQYNKWMFENLFYFIGDMPICKTYIVSIINSLWVQEFIIDLKLKNIIKNKLNII